MNDATKDVVVNPQAGALTLPPEWAGRLAEYAQETQQNEVVGGQFFSTRSGILSFGGTPIPGNTMDVVVVGSLFENVYYPEKFNAEKVKAPLCYAFSLDGNGMVPHDRAAEQQSAECKTCKWNAWGSGDGGRGKACKNMRRLGLLPISALKTPQETERGTLGYLRVPVTSVKHWSAHAQRLAASGIPPFAAVTRVTLKPDPKTQIRMEFDLIRVIQEATQLEALHKRFQLEKTAIAFPYPDREDDPAPAGDAATTSSVPPPPGGGKAAKF